MNRLLKFFERASLVSGFALLMSAALVWIDGRAHSQGAIEEFERIRDVIASAEDQAAWSEKRKAKYSASLRADAGETLAVLRIPAVDMEVPVLDSTSDLALNRGAGHVEGTAKPGERGNAGIAASSARSKAMGR